MSVRAGRSSVSFADVFRSRNRAKEGTAWRKAAGTKESTRRLDVQDNSALLLPFDLVEDFLATHDLVVGLSLSPGDVHAQIIKLHAAAMTHRSVAAPREQERGAIAARLPDACRNCAAGGNNIKTDAREGTLVCLSCGAVQNKAAINVVPEFRSPPVVARSGPGAARNRERVAGVPDRLYYSLLSPDTVGGPVSTPSGDEPSYAGDGIGTSSVRRDLLDLNQVVSLPFDDLLRAEDLLLRESGDDDRRSLRPRRFSHEKLVAALLYTPLLRRIPSSASIRRNIEREKGIERVTSLCENGRFECVTCGGRCHSAKDARFHCIYARGGRQEAMKRKRGPFFG